MSTTSRPLSIKIIFLLLAAGILSTIVMDLGGGILRSTGITAGVPPELTGKWIESAFSGNMFVDDIRTSAGEPVPLPRFLIYHYIIGIGLTFIFYFLISFFKTVSVPWWAPLLYGLATTLIPAFLMFPGMGFGILGLNGPEEYRLLITAILNHLFYGFGLTIADRFLLRRKRADVGQNTM